jgi:predicted transcriptional regulator
MRALAHPLRVRLVELFAERARTTKQAAVTLGVPPTRLYHHVHALERAGLLRLRETRRKRGTEEKYYETAVTVVRNLEGARGSGEEVTAVALSVLEAARLELATLPGGQLGGDRGIVARLRIRSPEAGERLQRDLRALLRRYMRASEVDSHEATAPASGEVAWSLSLLLLPVGSAEAAPPAAD